MVEGITPAIYKEWLCHCLEYTRKHHAEQERLVFINAWNEWGEGAYLEPDSRYGYAYYLQATREALLEENDAFRCRVPGRRDCVKVNFASWSESSWEGKLPRGEGSPSIAR
ncbi:MAG: glycoside hydrolase family 99-like domain-containing protein [Candidatus Accumulibacter sp.]|nr:glycoside hydrolase family 99-like domain-containing protein [Accumulibacter sp.]